MESKYTIWGQIGNCNRKLKEINITRSEKRSLESKVNYLRNQLKESELQHDEIDMFFKELQTINNNEQKANEDVKKYTELTVGEFKTITQKSKLNKDKTSKRLVRIKQFKMNYE